MATRFTDDIIHNIDGNDFIVRRRMPVTLQILFVFAIAFSVIYVTACLMSASGSQKIFSGTLLVTLSTLGWFTAYSISRLRDLVLATEFQNAMLASAAQLSTRFCLITKRDGSIVYVDPGFQSLFPHFMQSADRNIEGLFAGSGIASDLISRIIGFLQQNKSERILLPFRIQNGQITPMMMSVDYLARPKGYFLLRGRDFIEKREQENTAVTAAPHAPIMPALDLLSEGILGSDNGIVTYINHTLESWLGYAAGEIMAQPCRLSKIIHQYGGYNAGQPVMADFEGDGVLQRKDRSLIVMHIKQLVSANTSSLSVVAYGSADIKKSNRDG